MELDDLRGVLGLSSYKSDLRKKLNGISNQCKEWNCLNVAKRTVSAYLKRISEFKLNSQYHGSRRGEI